MSLRRALAFTLLSTLVLTACERKPASAPAAPDEAQAPALQAVPFKVVLKGEGCRSRCPSFSADWLRFPGQPALDRALLALVEVPGEQPEKGLRDYATAFLSDAAGAGWEQIMQARLKAGLGAVSVIDTESYSYTGGAHGMTTVAYLNWDRRQSRVLRLEDALLPGREPAFWQEVQLAHQAWVRTHDDAATLGAGWPFERTSNFALLPDALVLKYQPYAIAPYSEGTPELRVPYARLAGILKPEYLPAR